MAARKMLPAARCATPGAPRAASYTTSWDTSAGLTGDFNPLHIDEEFARETPFGRRIAHGMLGHSLSTGMRSEIDDWAIMAFLQTTRQFRNPIFAGDTIHYRAHVSGKRVSSSKPEQGIVKVQMELVNQEGVIVQAGEDVFLVARADDRKSEAS